MDFIDEFCKNKLLNSSLFRNNTAKFIDPNFDLKAFLCEVLKLTDLPDINPILEENATRLYDFKLDYSSLTKVGDPRVSYGLTLSAGFMNFMPRNIVYSETLKYGGAQVINNIVCNKDGHPIKVQTPGSILDKEPSPERDLEIFSILNSDEVKETFGNFDFTKQICMNEEPLTLADLGKSVDDVDLEPNPNVDLYSNEYYELFDYSYDLDLCTEPLDTTKLFERTTPDEYSKFTQDFIKFGYKQQLRYFIAFLDKFFAKRGWTVSIINSKIPPTLFLKVSKRQGNTDFVASEVLDVNNNRSYNYTSTIKNLYFKYYEDQLTEISNYYSIKQITTTAPNQPLTLTSQGMTRSIGDNIPDYRRIMRDAALQKRFYKYTMKYYLEIPKYYSTNTLITNPTLIPYSN